MSGANDAFSDDDAGVRVSCAKRAAYRAIRRCSSSLEVLARFKDAPALSNDRPVARESKVLLRSNGASNPESQNPLCDGSGDGGTMCDKFNVFSGCSGNL